MVLGRRPVKNKEKEVVPEKEPWKDLSITKTCDICIQADFVLKNMPGRGN